MSPVGERSLTSIVISRAVRVPETFDFADNGVPISIDEEIIAANMARAEKIPKEIIGLGRALLEVIFQLEHALGIPSDKRLGCLRNASIFAAQLGFACALPPDEHLSGEHAVSMMDFNRRPILATGPALRRCLARFAEGDRGPELGSERWSPHRQIWQVPMLPDEAVLDALADDDLHAPGEQSPAERRLLRAHRFLMQWLKQGSVPAWAGVTRQTADGPKFDGLQWVPPSQWGSLKVSYKAAELDAGRVRPIGNAYEAVWHEVAAGTEEERRREFNEIALGIPAFDAALATVTRGPTTAALIRPAGESGEWAVRFDGSLLSLGSIEGKQALARGLKSLWILIKSRGTPLPYLLLEACSYRHGNTRGTQGLVENVAKVGVRKRLHEVFERLWSLEISFEDSVQQTLVAIAAQNEDTTDVDLKRDFKYLLTVLRQVPSSPRSGRQTPSLATDAKGVVHRSIALAADEIKKAGGDRLSWLPTSKPRQTNPLVANLLSGKSGYWAEFAPLPSAAEWTAE